MLKKSEMKNFLLIVRLAGLIPALNEARIHFVKTIYNRLGIREILMYYLNAGRGTFTNALYKSMYSNILERKIGEGIDIMSEDWDNLIILDAYRSDYFKKYSQLEGKFTEVVSKGDHSHEFVKQNFRQEFWDTVIVTANVWYQKSPFTNQNTFFKMINPVSSERFEHRLITEAAIIENQKHPDKRLIVHYMSPHTPFEGALADDLQKPPWPGGIYQMFRCGVINKETLRESYRETINIIEQKVEKLLPHLKGKTIITSDHGENLGERQHGLKLISHGNPSEECRMVPWLVIECNERKVVQADKPIQNKVLTDYELNKRLKYLGYA